MGGSSSDKVGEGMMISSADIEVRFGNIVALDQFSVQVPSGIVGLLGPNGAGKSTFIKTVLGLVLPASGTINIAGLDPRKDVLAIRDMVGYMPEHDCLVESMTGLEMVAYFGRLSGMSLEDSIPRSHEVLDFVGLGEERYRLTGTYSTGMKQRVKLAQAIVHDPAILFLDEPTNGMDPVGREEMLELIGRIGASNKSILVSSHILQDMEKVCRHVIIINNGRAVTQGPLQALLDQGEGRIRLKVRGAPSALTSFVAKLRQRFQVTSVSEEFGQMTILLLNREGSGVVMEMAINEGVQVRSYTPDKITLEDVFIRSVKEVV
ncbi:MAG: putative ABC transporter ATP-binding protein [Methanomassiliicoccales archaeon PtaU1.Bin124]|nr:MAG: putative ABC transporter ATP-binding protein [Methanomassiliicoccales archaeon PtaU1.Bin124]